MGRLTLKSSIEAEFYFGLGAKGSALFLDRVMTIQENKERFGNSYDRATMWYSILHGIPVKKFTATDYDQCYSQWQIMTALGQFVDVVEVNGRKYDKLNLEDRFVERTFDIMRDMFGIKSDAHTKEDKILLINSCLSNFQRQTESKVLHKASCRVLKMSFDDLQDTGNGYVFDSRKAGQSTMRWILTSEDGISRLLADMGKEQVVVNLNTADSEDGAEVEAMYRKAKKLIFKDGITDVATGKHYLCSAPSASSTRHVDFPFVVADKPKEIYDLWCNITGFSSIEELASNIGSSKEGKIFVVFAKLKARIAQNGANSLSTGLTASPRVRERLLNANVVFVPDCKGTIDTPYKKISSLGVLSMEHPDGTVTYERV